ncbi:MAG TPA: sensor histidine kinase [Gammaproteobacteria bacterium]|nr:sensor histidine kinase [Gammaproteobacteria bacterium]
MAEMRNNSRDSNVWFHSSLWLPVALLGSLLMVTLAMEFMLAWQSYQRLQPINRHITQLVRLQIANVELQRELVDGLRGEGTFSTSEREKIGQELQAVIEARALLSQDSPALVAAARRALMDVSRQPKEALILALAQTRKVIDLEARAHQALVDKISRATALELRIGAITLILFPTGAALLLYLMRRRILAPLKRLSFLMTMLARSDYSHAPLTSVDPLLRPLAKNYNAMAARLAELEAEHEKREKNLESQVDSAAQALLEQQRNLANTERLATVGEMMARIAHELRNPLAGIKMACANLHKDLAQEPDNADYSERVDIVSTEIDRVIAVLNAMLDQARHHPEPLRDVNIGSVVTDLMTLARYQIPARIALIKDIPDDLVCRLPDAMLRQALLNLLLNARQAIDDQDGDITVRARAGDGMLYLSVIDDGPGFPVDLIKAGIHAFVSHRPGGTGLGLSMVQRFARARGGEVKLSDREPQGACVTLELPMQG